jgi:hypothetical protein
VIKNKNTPVEYTVIVKTGDVKHAGTDAKVHVILSGEERESAKIFLTPASKKDSFERGSVDTFTISSREVGNITRLRIGHDNTGIGPG